MFKYFWHRIKYFFISQSRLSRVTIILIVLVVVIGVFGLGQSALAVDDTFGQKIGRFFATILLYAAAFLGHVLVMIIGLLLEVVSYNNFVDATAVNYGWTVVRDICNLFFILILLVIGFGSVLRLESYKYNQLLGKLILMIVLVNFSRMIAGFFIDISQVVLMTFANAFAATAAENFTTALGLKEMLNFTSESADVDTITEALGGAEMFGLALLPVIMLVVAIFTMLAMLMVFLIRILMLWVLVVLSPLAYFFSVLPSTQQYGKKWWDNFTKWVVTGPVLAFFIWFGLTMIAGGAIEYTNLAGENEIQSAQGAGGGVVVAAGLGAASSSDSVLQFIMAIGMFVIALVTAQSLGGMAGGFAGKMLGKLQGMGTGALKLAGAPLRGVGELAKAGGRKIRRGYRDSKLGKYTNVGAMLAGAKQRGKEVEARSKELGDAKGRDVWDKRPGFMGGGAEPVSSEMMVQAKHTRQKASEIATLQKEQKANQLERLASGNSNSQENVLDRRAMVLGMANEGHIDDAMATEHFQRKQQWTDQYGQKHNGFSSATVTDEDLVNAAEDGDIDQTNEEEMDKLRMRMRYRASDGERTNFRDAESARHFMGAMVSKNYSAKAEDIDESGARTLYDAEKMMIKNSHYYAAGTTTYNEKLGRLAYVDNDKQHRELSGTEFNKQANRGIIGANPHNSATQSFDENGQHMYLVGQNSESMENDRFSKVAGSAANDAGEFGKHSSIRHIEMIGKKDAFDDTVVISNSDRHIDSLGEIYKKSPKFESEITKRENITGYKIYKNGPDQDATTYRDINHLNEDYVQKEVIPQAQKKYDDLENDPNATNLEKGRAKRRLEKLKHNWAAPTQTEEAEIDTSTPDAAHESTPDEESPTPIPRTQKVYTPAVLQRSRNEYSNLKNLPGFSPDDYEERNKDEIEHGEMMSRQDIERVIMAENQKDVDTMRGTRSVVAAGKREEDKLDKDGKVVRKAGATASGAVVVGLNFADEDIRKHYGVAEGSDAVRFDKSTPEREKSFKMVADRLAKDFEKQLHDQGMDDSIVGEEVEAFRKALEANQKIVISDNKAPTSRIETIRGHELQGHDEAQKMVDMDRQDDSGKLMKNDVGDKFYATLSKQQQEMADDMGMEEFAAEALGVGKGKYKLGDKSKQVLDNSKIKYTGSVEDAALPKTDDELETSAVSEKELKAIAWQAKKKKQVGNAVGGLKEVLGSAGTAMIEKTGIRGGWDKAKEIKGKIAGYFDNRSKRRAEANKPLALAQKKIDNYAQIAGKIDIDKARTKKSEAQEVVNQKTQEMDGYRANGMEIAQRMTQHNQDSRTAAANGDTAGAAKSRELALKEKQDLNYTEQLMNSTGNDLGAAQKILVEVNKEYGKLSQKLYSAGEVLLEDLGKIIDSVDPKQLEGALLGDVKKELSDKNQVAMTTAYLDDDEKQIDASRAAGTETFKNIIEDKIPKEEETKPEYTKKKARKIPETSEAESKEKATTEGKSPETSEASTTTKKTEEVPDKSKTGYNVGESVDVGIDKDTMVSAKVVDKKEIEGGKIVYQVEWEEPDPDGNIIKVTGEVEEAGLNYWNQPDLNNAEKNLSDQEEKMDQDPEKINKMSVEEFRKTLFDLDNSLNEYTNQISAVASKLGESVDITKNKDFQKLSGQLKNKVREGTNPKSSAFQAVDHQYKMFEDIRLLSKAIRELVKKEQVGNKVSEENMVNKINKESKAE